MNKTYEHFMLKEIYEQPEVVDRILSTYTKDGQPNFASFGLDDEFLTGKTRIVFAACGTALYAGTAAKHYIEKLARIPVTSRIASEFRYENAPLSPSDLVVVISQSGETSDTLDALRAAKRAGAPVLAVVNVENSAIAAEADRTLYTKAGTETAIASTKVYSAQVTLLVLIAIKLALLGGKLSEEKAASLVRSLAEIPDVINRLLSDTNEIRTAAQNILKDADQAFYIGRGPDACAAYEGSLKLKEVTYVHSEAYPAGELRHGPVSLLTPEFPIVAVAACEQSLERIANDIKDFASKGAPVLAVAKKGSGISGPGITVIELPECSEFEILPAVVVLQLISYYTGIAKGRDIDKPRNLTKAVTE